MSKLRCSVVHTVNDHGFPVSAKGIDLCPLMDCVVFSLSADPTTHIWKTDNTHIGNPGVGSCVVDGYLRICAVLWVCDGVSAVLLSFLGGIGEQSSMLRFCSHHARCLFHSRLSASHINIHASMDHCSSERDFLVFKAVNIATESYLPVWSGQPCCCVSEEVLDGCGKGARLFCPHQHMCCSNAEWVSWQLICK